MYTDGRFATSNVFKQFCSHAYNLYFNKNFHLNAIFSLPNQNICRRESATRWRRLHSDACEHSHRNQWEPKNRIRKSDDGLHVYTIAPNLHRMTGLLGVWSLPYPISQWELSVLPKNTKWYSYWSWSYKQRVCRRVLHQFTLHSSSENIRTVYLYFTVLSLYVK